VDTYSGFWGTVFDNCCWSLFNNQNFLKKNLMNKPSFKPKIPVFVIKTFLSFAIMLGALGIIRLFSFYGRMSGEDEQYVKAFKDEYKVFAVNIPDNLSFAGEKVPVNDFDVRERLDREFLINTYWQSQTLLMIKRANRWLPILAQILKKNSVPEDFKYLALVESGFTHQVSPKGAAGFWQFIPSTAKEYGLRVDDEIDERYHVEKSTEAACRYFKDSYKQFKNWTLVAASFNMGPNGLAKQLEKQQVNNYYDLLLNEETSRYVCRVIAVKEIISNPKDYGFIIRQKDLYPHIPTRTVTIDSSIANLTSFAELNNINYKIIKYFNPWIRSSNLKNEKKNLIEIKLPSSDYKDYDKLLKLAETESELENSKVE
jgi:membrane-bound lytic murein transglycosylase D